MVTIQMRAAGDVSDFDTARRDSIAAAIATEAGVPASSVVVTVVAASVSILVEIRDMSETRSNSVRVRLEQLLFSANHANDFFTNAGISGMTIISPPRLAVEWNNTPPAAPNALSPIASTSQMQAAGGGTETTSSPAGGIIAIIIVFVLLAIAALAFGWWMKRRGGLTKTVEVQKKDYPMRASESRIDLKSADSAVREPSPTPAQEDESDATRWERARESAKAAEPRSPQSPGVDTPSARESEIRDTENGRPTPPSANRSKALMVAARAKQGDGAEEEGEAPHTMHLTPSKVEVEEEQQQSSRGRAWSWLQEAVGRDKDSDMRV